MKTNGEKRCVIRANALGEISKTKQSLTIPSLIGVIALSAMYYYGLNRHALGYAWTLAPPPGAKQDPNYVKIPVEPTNDRIILTRKLEYSSLVIFPAMSGLIKISVLSFYRRIFVVIPNFKNARNLFFIAAMVVIGMWSTSFVFTLIFMCGTQIQTLFTELENMAIRCTDTYAVGYGLSVSGFISDTLIIIIPIPYVCKLSLPLGRKIGVLGVFILGTLAVRASLVRMSWMIWNNMVGFGIQNDEELMTTTELYWMMLEFTLGLLSACLPTLFGLFRLVQKPRWLDNSPNLACCAVRKGCPGNLCPLTTLTTLMPRRLDSHDNEYY